jgi:hypothetical protein
MASQSLLGPQVEQGKATLRALDGAGLAITAAFWMYEDSTNDWRFVVADASIDTNGPRSFYESAMKSLEKERDTLPLSEIYVTSPENPIVKLTKVILPTDSRAIGGAWSHGNAVNGQLLPDMYIYRMS